MSPELEALVAPYLKPISAASAVGEDAKYDPRYEAVRNELAKLSSAAGAQPQWSVVVEAGTDLLSTTTKDASIAGDLAVAWASTRGVEGAATGLALVAGLLASFEDIHPARPRARANLVATMVERMTGRLEAIERVASRTEVELLRAAVEEFGQTITSRLSGDAPSTRGLRDQCERLLRLAPAPVALAAPPTAPTSAVPSVKSVAAAPTSPAPPVVATPAPPTPPTDARAIDGFLKVTANGLLDVAKTVRRDSPWDARALRLTMLGLYLVIAKLPSRKLALSSDRQLTSDLARLESAGMWGELAEKALASLPANRFSVDLHHALHRALAGLGAPAAAALAAHASEVRGLVDRLPDLLDAEFSDGVPCASDEAKTWVSSLAPAASSVPPLAVAPKTDERLTEARRSIDAGRVESALTDARAWAESAPDARSRFERRLELAKLVERAKSARVAELVYESLLREAQERCLDTWEPALVAAAAAPYYRLLAAKKGDASAAAAASAVLARLVAADPGLATKVTGT